ncbi:HK97 gp10 family phage protein [Nitratireductor sp. StC3]|uniref:HK97 gp10 family phage protein n=1 Tax=Nitratireductor sp. StC3 TaxID=2126741 RepID=UPI001FE23F2E|nr:HK97 gp10 family phage protein [Nitratireductor sp. StC3]
MAKSFTAQIEEWARKVEGAVEAIFKEAVHELVEQADQLLTQLVYEAPPSPNYRRTGFLRASVTASNASMPPANRPQGVPDGGYMAEIEIVIAGSDLGQTIYIGWTAEYSGYVHYGANGTVPKPWVDLVAQRWRSIVDDKTAELKKRLGL